MGAGRGMGRNEVWGRTRCGAGRGTRDGARHLCPEYTPTQVVHTLAALWQAKANHSVRQAIPTACHRCFHTPFTPPSSVPATRSVLVGARRHVAAWTSAALQAWLCRWWASSTAVMSRASCTVSAARTLGWAGGARLDRLATRPGGRHSQAAWLRGYAVVGLGIARWVGTQACLEDLWHR